MNKTLATLLVALMLMVYGSIIYAGSLEDAAAKRRGAYQGRKPTARAKTNEIFQLKKSGKGVAEICAALSVSRASVYRILNNQTGA